MSLKSLAKQVLGESGTGVVEYFIFPDRKSSWGGAFNGQVERRKIFLELLERVPLTSIVETGTYRGTTTEFFLRSSSGRIFTVERNPRFHAYSRARFMLNRRVFVVSGDSRTFLRSFEQDSAFRSSVVFFYLDAHWEEDLPLREELDQIFRTVPKAVVMIDDFQVPQDDAYQFDDYGPGRALTLKYLRPVMDDRSLAAFFPAAPGSVETGMRRGSVVLAGDATVVEQISAMQSLRRFRGEMR